MWCCFVSLVEYTFQNHIYSLPDAEWRRDVKFSSVPATRRIRMFTGSSDVIDSVRFGHAPGTAMREYEKALSTRRLFGLEANNILKLCRRYNLMTNV